MADVNALSAQFIWSIRMHNFSKEATLSDLLTTNLTSSNTPLPKNKRWLSKNKCFRSSKMTDDNLATAIKSIQNLLDMLAHPTPPSDDSSTEDLTATMPKPVK
jgi:hypothetical protein